jgi:outer membrane protein assembly factor BamA
MTHARSFSRRLLQSRRLLAFSFALALITLAPHAFGAVPQKTSGSAKIQTVTVAGSTKYQSDQIVPITGLHVGQVVTRADIQNGADALAAIGLFSSVKYNFFTGILGVQIKYEVADAPTVPVFFDNLPWFTDAQLTAFIKSSVALFDGAVPKSGKILDQISNSLEQELQTRTITADVSHELLTLPYNEQEVMVFRADGENMPVVQSVQFSDSLAGTNHAIADRIGDLVGKPYSRMAVATFEFEQVRPVYLAEAYLTVKFGDPVPQMSGNKVIIQAPITPGPAFTWNGLTWEGDSAIPAMQLNTLVNLIPGASANGMQLLGAWEKVKSAFENLGYLDVTVDATPHFDDAAKRVSYDVKVTQGPQYHMGKLVLSGLSMEGERRLRGAWKIAPGAVFNDGTYQDFLDSGIKQAFAGLPFHYQTVQKFLDKHPEQGQIDVMLNFE